MASRRLTLWIVGAAGALAVAAPAGCGEESAAPTRDTTDTTVAAVDAVDAPSDSSTTSTSVAAREWAGPPVLVTATDRDLVAVELSTGDHVVLADGRELADSLGILQGRFEDADLSPDGSTVAFTFGAHDGARPAFGLYEVPADGTADPTVVDLGDGNGFATRPRYSPDGRLLAVYDVDRVVVLDEQRRAADDGIPLAYAPHQMTWTAAGDQLVWLEHYERTSCCDLGSVDVDPQSGRTTSASQHQQGDGSPYVDADGELDTLPRGYPTSSVDRSGRFVVASDGTPGVLWWWGLEGDLAPEELDVGLDLQEVPPLAW